MVKENQFKNLETEIVSLNLLKGSLKELNDKAIDAIANKFKNIIDGGSKDMKIAMDTFDIVSH